MKYQVTVRSIVEAENEEQAAEHLWDGQTDVDVKALDPPKVLVKTIWYDQDEVIKMVMTRYDEIVRGNDSPSWNTIRAVHMDSAGEQAYEVVETADDMGVVLRDADDLPYPIWDALWDAAADYRKSLTDDPRNIPSGNGED